MTTTLLSLLPSLAGGQVISSWDRPGKVVTSVEMNSITDTMYAAQGIFMDWTGQLADMETAEVITEGDIQEKIKQDGDTKENRVFRARTGMDYNLPEIIAPDGTDLYMLTQEGITIYMALDAPVYFQEITEQTVRLVRYYAHTKKSYTERMFRRYENWANYLKQYFRNEGLPEELTELCLVESGCTYTALSSAGARGMWQLMPATARSHGLTVNDLKDDRVDPILATAAAVKVLKADYNRIGEWTLAVASYNCGAGRIQKYSSKGMQWDQVQPLLPKETQNYIPALLALHYVWTYRDRLGFKNNDKNTN